MNTTLTSSHQTANPPRITGPAYSRNTGLTAQLLQQGIRTAGKMPTLQKLFAGQPVRESAGDLRQTVRRLCTDSRRVTPGAIFFALPGRRTAGKHYVEEAIDRGALAIVSPEKIWVPRKVTLIVVDSIRQVLAETARRFYGEPEKALALTGITGTSGKTVVATLLRHLMEEREPVGLLGTIHYSLGRRTLPAYRTTPEPVDLYAMLSQMEAGQCRRAILEVSSHGIDQGRVDRLRFETLAFLNLTEQHLDYHGSLEHYYATVKKAFDGTIAEMPKQAVLNLDDPFGVRLLAELPTAVETLTFGLSERAQVRATELRCTAQGTHFTLTVGDQSWPVYAPMLGEFNVSNVLAAFALGSAAGLSWEAMIARLASFEGARGRMERVDNGQAFNVVVDYMHSPESYRRGLEMLRAITPGKLITVFGCGGDRDRRQRPVVTETVMAHSDLAFATADNPRSEDLETIFDDMRQGVRVRDPIHFVENRRLAISLALEAARPGDTVLVAGKGHETFQEYADSVMPFDDRAVLRELIQKKLRYEV